MSGSLDTLRPKKFYVRWRAISESKGVYRSVSVTPVTSLIKERMGTKRSGTASGMEIPVTAGTPARTIAKMEEAMAYEQTRAS